MPARIRTAILVVAIAGTLAALVGGTLSGLRTGIGIAAGSAIAASNLYALARIVRALATPDGNQSAVAWGFLALFKMTGLFVVIWLLLRWQVVAPIPLVIGYGALPIGIAIGSMVSDKTDNTDA